MARTMGVSSASVEEWLIGSSMHGVSQVAIEAIEPWDYRYAGGGAERALGDAVTREMLQRLSARYYADLGADLASMGTLYDLEPRPGKAPLAYADFVSRGAMVGDAWRPTVTRVSANYSRGGLGVLNELVHEDGHVVHMMAVRTRPAFMDLGDALFVEAFADVPAWNTFDPAWQRKYLGRSAPADRVAAIPVLVGDAGRGLGAVRASDAARSGVRSERGLDRDHKPVPTHRRAPRNPLVGRAGAARRFPGLHGQLRSRSRAHCRSARAHRRSARVV